MSDYIPIEAIVKAAGLAFGETVTRYADECTQVIEEVGAFSSHPQSDIVLSGKLRDSQQVTLSATSAEIAYHVPYAEFVRVGYVRRNGTVEKGRDWFALAAGRLDLEATFTMELNKRL